MNIHLVLTTINHPSLLQDYAEHAATFKNGNVAFTVAGDKKTPPSARQLCEELEKKYGLPVRYMGEEEQNAFLKPWPEFARYLPWNCVQRRNVGVMQAYSAGADIIVTIDDDNFIAAKNYFEGHILIGQSKPMPTAYDPSGWFNICQLLQDENGRLFYPRGYPGLHRKQASKNTRIAEEAARIVVNGGLWLGDPDIDAVTRLAAPINAVSYSRENNIALGRDIWCPFNSQNTGLHRDCIPAYFLSPFIGRYDDIWASYIILRLANHLGDRIAFGDPLVRQDRNAHDLWRDLDLERTGMQLTDRFCDWLREIPLTGNSYLESGKQLIAGLREKADKNQATLNETQKTYLDGFAEGYEKWLNLDLWNSK